MNATANKTLMEMKQELQVMMPGEICNIGCICLSVHKSTDTINAQNDRRIKQEIY